jgi:hypothetical protein
MAPINREKKPDVGRKGEKNTHVKKKSARVEESVSCVKETSSCVKEIIYAFGKKSTHVEETSSCGEKKICIFEKKSIHVMQKSTRVDEKSTCVEKKSHTWILASSTGIFCIQRYLSARSDYAQSGTVPIFIYFYLNLEVWQ